MGPIGFILVCTCILAFNLLRYFRVIGFPSRYVVLPYQSGLLYKRGYPVKAAGPGRHRVFVGTEKILFLDMRPIQFNCGDRAVALADGVTAVFNFSMSAKVSEVRKAVYASPTYTQIPAFAALCAARSTLNAHPSGEFLKGRKALEEEIATACRLRLAASGFELVSFQLTRFDLLGSGAVQI